MSDAAFLQNYDEEFVRLATSERQLTADNISLRHQLTAAIRRAEDAEEDAEGERDARREACRPIPVLEQQLAATVRRAEDAERRAIDIYNAGERVAQAFDEALGLVYEKWTTGNRADREACLQACHDKMFSAVEVLAAFEAALSPPPEAAAAGEG